MQRRLASCARLHLKTVVDADIVNQVQKYFSNAMLDYGEVIKAAIDPREIACEEIIKVYILQANIPIHFEDAARQACQQNPQIKEYLGSSLKLRDNNKLREVSIRVKEYSSNIKIVQLKPLLLEWVKADDIKTTSNGGGG